MDDASFRPLGERGKSRPLLDNLDVLRFELAVALLEIIQTLTFLEQGVFEFADALLQRGPNPGADGPFG